jgi:hypothetical protein
VKLLSKENVFSAKPQCFDPLDKVLAEEQRWIAAEGVENET